LTFWAYLLEYATAWKTHDVAKYQHQIILKA